MLKIIRNATTGEGQVYDHGRVNLLDWLDAHAPELADKRVGIEINGQMICDTGKSKTPNGDCDVFISPRDSVLIGVIPEGTTGVMIGIAILSTAATLALAPSPSVPADAGRQRQSPNNQLNASQNEFRPGQAIPEIYGEVVSYPDFVQPSYYEYIDNRRFFRELLLVSDGYCDVSRVRSGSADLNDIEDADYTVYHPGDSIPEQVIANGTEEVDGYELTPSDDPSRELSLDGATVTAPNTFGGISTQQINLEDGDTVFIDASWNGGQDTLQGELEVENVTGASFDVVGVVLNSSQNVGDVTGYARNLTGTSAGPWFRLVGTSISEVWFQVVANEGLQDDQGGTLQVDLSIQVQRITSAGVPISNTLQEQTVNLSGGTRSAVRETFKLSTAFPARYRARVVRDTPAESGGIDRVQVEDILSVRTYTPDFNDRTCIFVTRLGTEQPLSSRDSKINMLAQREIPLFNPETGEYGAQGPTRSFAQAVMHLMARGGVPISNTGYQSLFDIEASISSLQNRFDFTFDDADVSLRDRIVAACNAARVKVYTVGNQWFFTREEPQSIRKALFGRRDIIKDSARQVWRPFRPSDYDSVEIEYVDPNTNAPAYVRRKINEQGQIESGLGQRTKEMRLAGCRTTSQATDRANYEIQRMRYQRRSMELTANRHAQGALPGERVSVDAVLDKEIVGGEIVGIDGDIYTSSEELDLSAGDYMVYITTDDGECTSAVTVTQVSDYEFEAPGLSGAFTADGYTAQVGSRFVIAKEADLAASDWVIVSRGQPDERGRVQLELVNYDPRVSGVLTVQQEEPEEPREPAEPGEPLQVDFTGGDETVTDVTCINADATGEILASGGTGEYSYIWQKMSGDGEILTGSESATMTVRFENVCPGASKGGIYRCAVISGDEIETIDAVYTAENNSNVAEI